MPYIEQQPLHDLGKGLPRGSQAALDAGTQRIVTPVKCFYCPTRRPAAVYPWPASYTWWTFGTNFNAPSSTHALAVRCDYCMCGGEYWTYAAWPNAVQDPYGGPLPTLSPRGYLYVDGPGYNDAHLVATTMALSPYWPAGVPGPARANGVSFALSMIKASDITDGLSNTYLLGEKNLCPDAYENGNDGGDIGCALEGFHYETHRFANDYSHCQNCSVWRSPPGPAPDTPGDYTHDMSFGSAHFAGFSMAFCDGSVRMIGYTIDLEAHRRLCNRNDGLPVDAKKF